MRNTFTILALLLTTALSAQLKKGDWNINTSTDALTNLRLRSNGQGFRTYDFGVNPGVGYFLTDRWEIGGGPTLSFNGTRYKDPAGAYGFNNRSSSVGWNLYTRYYLKKEGKLIPYLTLNGTYERTSLSSTNFDGTRNKYSFNQWQVGGGAGLSWFVSPKVALFGELLYSGDWGSGNPYGGGTGYMDGLNFRIGIQVFLNRKKKNK